MPSPATVANLVTTPIAGQQAYWFATATSTPSLPLTTPLTTGTYYVLMAPIGSNLRTIAELMNTNTTSNRVPVNVVVQNNTPGNAISLIAGTDDRLRVPNTALLNPTTAITIEFWVRRLTATKNFDMVVAKTSADNSWGTGYGFYWANSGQKIEFFRNGFSNRITGATVLPLNTWFHVAATYDGATIKLYINGVLDGSANQTGPVGTNALDLFIGSNSISTYTATCDIDMIRLWSTARTAAQISGNLANCIPASTTGLIAQYDFEEAAGSTAFADTSGNNLTGTYTNLETADWIVGGNCGNNATLSTNSTEFSSELTVYPNPSNDIFNVNLDEDATIQVLDLLGKQILTQKIQSGTSQVDLSNFSKGVYLMKITNEANQQKVVKLVKK